MFLGRTFEVHLLDAVGGIWLLGGQAGKGAARFPNSTRALITTCADERIADQQNQEL